MAHLVGADGCTGGWITAERANGVFSCARVERIEVLFERFDSPEVVAVDAPIGLVERGARACDLAARAVLGSRRSSVFPAPLRPLLAAASYAEASSLRRAIEGKGLSRQTWAIVPKIVELDLLLRGNAAARAALREVHPEVSFLKLNRDRPLRGEQAQARGPGRASRAAARLVRRRDRPRPRRAPRSGLRGRRRPRRLRRALERRANRARRGDLAPARAAARRLRAADGDHGVARNGAASIAASAAGSAPPSPRPVGNCASDPLSNAVRPSRSQKLKIVP